MAKSKSKIDFKQILLAKGEYIALGVAGFFLAILLFSGVSKLTSARDPAKISNDLKQGADLVISRINGSQISDTDVALTVPPNWIVKPFEGNTYGNKQAYPNLTQTDLADVVCPTVDACTT